MRDCENKQKNILIILIFAIDYFDIRCYICLANNTKII